MTKEVTKEVTNKLKIEFIDKALKKGKLSIEEIAEDNDVSIDFVLDIQSKKSWTRFSKYRRLKPPVRFFKKIRVFFQAFVIKKYLAIDAIFAVFGNHFL